MQEGKLHFNHSLLQEILSAQESVHWPIFLTSKLAALNLKMRMYAIELWKEDIGDATRCIDRNEFYIRGAAILYHLHAVEAGTGINLLTMMHRHGCLTVNIFSSYLSSLSSRWEKEQKPNLSEHSIIFLNLARIAKMLIEDPVCQCKTLQNSHALHWLILKLMSCGNLSDAAYIFSQCRLYQIPTDTYAEEICNGIQTYCSIRNLPNEPWLVFVRKIYSLPHSDIVRSMLNGVMCKAYEKGFLSPDYNPEEQLCLFHQFLSYEANLTNIPGCCFWLDKILRHTGQPYFEETKKFLTELVVFETKLDPMVGLIILARLDKIFNDQRKWLKLWKETFQKFLSDKTIQDQALLFLTDTTIVNLSTIDPIWTKQYIDHLTDQLLIAYEHAKNPQDLTPLYHVFNLLNKYEVKAGMPIIQSGDTKELLSWIEKAYDIYWQKSNHLAEKLERALNLLKIKFPELRKKISKTQVKIH